MLPEIGVNVLVFGGGAAGLWVLDRIRRAGYSALLVEASALGEGQTIASQGIIHGGTKYNLAGGFTDDVRAISAMPALWRECLDGKRRPDLRGVRRRSENCVLWSTKGVSSRLGMLGSRLALQVRPETIPLDAWPRVLEGGASEVARLGEQVVEPRSLLTELAALNTECLLIGQLDAVRLKSPGLTETLTIQDRDRRLVLRASHIVLTAGVGNAPLRAHLGLSEPRMQTRPLHMVLCKGALPVLNGHCVDLGRTRITVTTIAASPTDEVVWQIGGQIAEDGVAVSGAELIRRAVSEISDMMPKLRGKRLLWGTYRADRAEKATDRSRRPSDVGVLEEGHVITAWPTKLALVPRLADRIAELISCKPSPQPKPEDWARPAVATPPWETCNWRPETVG